MYQIESVFIGESQPSSQISLDTEIKSETINENRVGDIIRLAPKTFTLNCVQCSKAFRDFPEFTLHIEEHFMQNEAFTSCKDGNLIQNDIKFDEIVPVELIDEGDFGGECELDDDVDYCRKDLKSEQNVPSIRVNRSPSSSSSPNDIEGERGVRVQQAIEKHKPTSKFIPHQKPDKPSKKDLKTPLTVHEKEPNIFCQICMRGFVSVYYAQKHIKSIHKQTLTAKEIRKAQNTLKRIVRPKKGEQNANTELQTAAMMTEANVKLNVLSSNYWRSEGKTFHCFFCIKYFTVPKYVQKHIRLVHGQYMSIDEIKAAQIQSNELKPDQTATVERVKQQQIQSLQHQAAVADPGKRIKSFECFVCHTMFAHMKGLRYHLPLHEGIQFACPNCDKYFSMRKYVRDHMIYRHNFDKKSKLPPLKWRKLKNFEYHRPVVSRFECYLCHRTYATRSKLTAHGKIHTEILNCSICEKLFKSHESRRRHMQLHSAKPNRFHCSICNKAFAIRRYMMSHMRTCYRKASASGTTSEQLEALEKPQIQTCSLCQKTFDKPSAFNKHMRGHSKEPTRYICDCCGYEFNDSHLLRKHLSAVHKINRKHFKCSICQKVLPKKREEEHLKWHRGEKEHQCEICGNQYATAGLLNTHKKRQHNDQEYECNVCFERFDHPRKLLHHRRSHTEAMEIHCSYCQLGFFNARSLNEHVMKKHAEHLNLGFGGGDSDSNT